jgi:hypothetical protein
MAMTDEPRRKPAVLPPAPLPGDGEGIVSVPRLEPPPSSLKPIAQYRPAAPAPESRGFWLLLVLLFVAGTAITFYFQR